MLGVDWLISTSRSLAVTSTPSMLTTLISLAVAFSEKYFAKSSTLVGVMIAMPKSKSSIHRPLALEFSSPSSTTSSRSVSVQ